MKFLELLAEIRTPFFNTFFSLITHLGEETVFLVVAIALIWCVNKKYGFYILYCGLIGQSLNQFLKLEFRVERPWIANPDFSPVESAIKEARGFSFPSGHTQIATNTYGGLALLYRKNKVLCLFFSALVILIGFSRMYLGVHYPTDVIVSFAISITVSLLIFYIGKKRSEHNFSPLMRWLGIVLILALFIYSFIETHGKTDNVFYADSIDFAAKMLGATLGFALSWWLDDRYINFDTRASWYIQIFKVVVGAAILIAVKEGVKVLFVQIGLPSPLSHILRYFFVVVFAGTLWPLCFTKLVKKK